MHPPVLFAFVVISQERLTSIGWFPASLAGLFLVMICDSKASQFSCRNYAAAQLKHVV